jgi:hypothetical protein
MSYLHLFQSFTISEKPHPQRQTDDDLIVFSRCVAVQSDLYALNLAAGALQPRPARVRTRRGSGGW